MCVCSTGVLIRVASRYHLTFTTEYIHNVLKTSLPLVTRPCRFDQITRGKIKPRTEGFTNHVPIAAILIRKKTAGTGDLSCMMNDAHRPVRTGFSLFYLLLVSSF